MSDSTTSTTPKATPARRRAGWLKLVGAGLAVCLITLLLITGGALFWLGSADGDRFLQETVVSMLHKAGIEARLGALRGPVPSALELENLELADAEGVWLTLDKARLRLDVSALLFWQLRCLELRVEGLQVLRAPHLPPSPEQDKPEEGSFLDMTRWPGWLPAIVIETLDVDPVQLSPVLLGLAGKEPIRLALHGSAETAGGSDEASADPLTLRLALRLEAGLAGRPDSTQLDVRGQLELGSEPQLALWGRLDEESGGLLGRLAGLPAEAPLEVQLEGNAPLQDWRGRLAANVAELMTLSSELRLQSSDGTRTLVLNGDVAPGNLLPAGVRAGLGDVVRVGLEAGMSPGAIRLPRLEVRTKALELRGQALELAGERGVDPALAGKVTLKISEPAALDALVALPFAQAVADLELNGTLRAPRIRLTGQINALRLGTDVATSHPDIVLDLGVAMHPDKLVTLRGSIDAQGSTALPKGADRLQLDIAIQREPDGVLIHRLSAASTLAELSASGQWRAAEVFPGVQGEATVTFPRLGELCTLLGVSGIDAGRLAISASLDPCATSADRPADGTDAVHATDTQLAGAVRVKLEGMQWSEQLATLRKLVGGEAELQAQVRGTTPARPGAGEGQGRLTVSDLTLQVARGTVKGHGALVLGARPEFEAVLDGRLAALDALTPAVSGELRLSAQGRGLLTAPQGTLTISSPRLVVAGEALTGVLARAECRAELAVANRHAEGRVTFDAQSQSGPARLESHWTWHNNLVSVQTIKALLAGVDCTGQLDVRLPEAQSRMPALSGELTASVQDWVALDRVIGPVRAETASLNVAFQPQGGRQDIKTALTLRGLAVGTAFQQTSLSGTATIEDLFGKIAAQASMTLGRGGVRGIRNLRWNGGQIKAGWTAGMAEASASLTGRTRLDAALRLQGSALDVERLTFNMADKCGFALERPLTVRGIGGSAPAVDAALRLTPSGSLTVQGRLGSRWDLTARLERLSLSLAQLFAGNEVPDGEVSMQARLTGSAAAPDLDARLMLDKICFPDSVYQPVACTLTARLPARAQTLLVDLQTQGLGAEGLRGSLSLPVRYGPNGPSLNWRGACSGELAWAGQLAPLWQFVPLADVRVTGEGRLSATLAGTLEKPRPAVTLDLARTSISELKGGVELSDITLALRLPEQGNVTLDLRGSDGRKGTLELRGQADIEQPGVPLAMHGVFSNFAPLSRRDLSVSLNGQLDVGGTAAAPDVRGKVTVEHGELQLENLSGGGFTTLDVEVIREDDEPLPAEDLVRQTVGRIQLLVEIPGRFFVRGHGVESEWRGSLDVHGPLTNPAVSGSIEAVRGVISLLGKSFTLARGEVRFNGETPPAPLLDVVVRRNTSKIVAEARLSGSVRRPRLVLSSQPPMPQDEVVSQMLFGRAPGELSRAEAIQLGAAVASLSGFGSGAGIMDMTRNLLGMDVLRLGSSRVKTARQSAGNPLAGPSSAATEGDEDPSSSVIEIGKYVRDDVYVGVQQGIGSNTTEVFVDIELTPNLDLEARTSSEASEIGVNWSWDY